MISLSWSMTVACISAIALLMVVLFRGRDERDRETYRLAGAGGFELTHS